MVFIFFINLTIFFYFNQEDDQIIFCSKSKVNKGKQFNFRLKPNPSTSIEVQTTPIISKFQVGFFFVSFWPREQFDATGSGDLPGSPVVCDREVQVSGRVRAPHPVPQASSGSNWGRQLVITYDCNRLVHWEQRVLR